MIIKTPAFWLCLPLDKGGQFVQSSLCTCTCILFVPTTRIGRTAYTVYICDNNRLCIPLNQGRQSIYILMIIKTLAYFLCLFCTLVLDFDFHSMHMTLGQTFVILCTIKSMLSFCYITYPQLIVRPQLGLFSFFLPCIWLALKVKQKSQFLLEIVQLWPQIFF